MPCKLYCELRQLLLIKEEKIGNLQQAIRWVDDLGRQEPHRRAEVEAKKAIVNTKLVETLAEVGQTDEDVGEADAEVGQIDGGVGRTDE